MTGDRGQYPREPIDGLDAGSGSGRRRSQRDPAAAHFRRLGETALEAREAPPTTPGTTPCRFEVYRTDEVRMTATRFAGGDWHWRLCDGTGQVLVDAGGYRDERLCREAVAILRDRAVGAAVAPRL